MTAGLLAALLLWCYAFIRHPSFSTLGQSIPELRLPVTTLLGLPAADAHAVPLESVTLNQSPQGETMLRIPLPVRSLDAGRLPLLQLHIQAANPQFLVALLWKDATQAQHLVALPQSHDAKVWVDLARNPYWRGQVTDLTLLLGAFTPPLTLGELRFLPLDPVPLLLSTLNPWSFVGSWQGSSINFNRPLPNETPTLASITGLWLLLAYLLALLLHSGFPGPSQRRALAMPLLALVAIGWIINDGFWQERLWFRVFADSYPRFAGLSPPAKHLKMLDAELYSSIAQLKQRLASAPQRVFLVPANNLSNGEYLRRRANFHLLPYNVFAEFQELPGRDLLLPGDLVVWLGRTNPEDAALTAWRQQPATFALEEIWRGNQLLALQVRP